MYIRNQIFLHEKFNLNSETLNISLFIELINLRDNKSLNEIYHLNGLRNSESYSMKQL